jgi:hypothetical protein
MSIHRQRGVTAIGWLIILGLIAFFSLIAIKLLPIYSEYFSVSTSLESVGSLGNLSEKQGHEIRELVFNRFYINGVTSIGRKDIIVQKRSRNVEISVDYEVRKNLFANIDIVVHFKKSVQG